MHKKAIIYIIQRYKCYGSIMWSGNFFFTDAPFIINSTDYAEGFIGKSVHVNCEVKSAPKILDVTLQSERTILNADVFNISTGIHQKKFTFTINEPTLQDSGNYTCNATNEHASRMSEAITLEIYGGKFYYIISFGL